MNIYDLILGLQYSYLNLIKYFCMIYQAIAAVIYRKLQATSNYFCRSVFVFLPNFSRVDAMSQIYELRNLKKL